jgi:hypothetical protein
MKKEKKENILINLMFNIVVPALILSKLSKYLPLAPYQVLIIALAFPLGYGIYDFAARRKANAISILGFVSILLTGIVGLFEFPAEWIAIKEASVPLVIAIAVLVSIKTRYPLVKTFIYNDKILDTARIDSLLEENGKRRDLERMLTLSSVFLACSFLVSTVLNFSLARILIKHATGTPEFNEELGKMTALSYPVIALPCTIIMALILWYLIHSLTKLSGLPFEELLTPQMREKSSK